MKKYAVRILAALVLVVALCSAALGADSKGAVEIFGHGDLVKLLADSKGKVVVINFFATWCPPCREEIPGLINIRKSYDADKLVLIGASIDEDMNALNSYMAKVKFNYPVKKTGNDLMHAANVQSVPKLLVFNPKGELAANHDGYIPEKYLRDFIQKQLEVK